MIDWWCYLCLFGNEWVGFIIGERRRGKREEIGGIYVCGLCFVKFINVYVWFSESFFV